MEKTLSKTELVKELEAISHSLSVLSFYLEINEPVKEEEKKELRTGYELLQNKITLNYQGITMPIHDVDIVGGIENVKEFIKKTLPDAVNMSFQFIKNEERGVYEIVKFKLY